MPAVPRPIKRHSILSARFRDFSAFKTPTARESSIIRVTGHRERIIPNNFAMEERGDMQTSGKLDVL